MAAAPRLALFDLDDTLVDRDAAYRRWCAAFAERMAGGDPEVVGWLIEVDELGVRDRTAWAAEVAARFELVGEPEAFREQWHAEYVEHYTIDQPAVAALRSLREAGWRIGIVTNGPPSQQDKITRNGLHELVDAAIVSELVGSRKPLLPIFEAAAERCGAPLAGGWMVGDSAPSDMAGALGAGLGSIWMHRGRTWEDVAGLPDPWVEQLGLPWEPLPAGWAPNHQVASVPEAAAIILAS